MTNTPIVELSGVGKRFGNIRALSGIGLRVGAGEVTCILGDNGAGKSTLIKIISGLHRHDEGEYLVDGERVRFTTPREALARGIATVYQDLAMVGLMPVWRNFFLGAELEAERAFGRRLVQVGFMRRYDPAHRTLKQAVGTLGAPLIVHCAHRNADVPDSYTSDMAVHDTAIHEIDTLRWLLGEDFVSAGAILPRRSSRAAAHLVDPQILLLETGSGVRVDIEVHANCAYGYDIRCEVVGETGVARLPDLVTADWRERFEQAFDAELGEWVGSIAAGQLTGPSAWDGYAAAVTADALVEAVGEQRRVDISMKDRPEGYR